MKNLLLALFLLSVGSTFAQTESNCFIEYFELFNARGCNPIPDGEHNVIITVRDTKEKSCFAGMGTILVKGGIIVGQLKIKTRAGNYHRPKKELHPGYYDPNHSLHADFSIKNGVSRNFLTKDMKIVNCFFIDFLKAQEASPAPAPAPKSL